MEVLTRYNMPEGAARMGVAVSGGADSVALLHLLFQCLSNPTQRLTVLHVNHKLRGEASDVDEAFVRDLAGTLRLPIYVEGTGMQSSEPGNLEQAARDMRRSFFFRMRDELRLACVALGHNESDQAETILFRLLRGSGMSGLAGMRVWTEDGLFRPLLAASRRAIREWAAAENVAWREDSTNVDLRFTRNRIRLQVIPVLAGLNPKLESSLSQFAELAQTEEDWWSQSVGQVLSALDVRQTVFGNTIPVSQLQTLHPALARRVVRALLAQLRGDLRGIEGLHIQAVLGLCRESAGHDRVLLPGVDAVRSFGTLLLTTPGFLSGQGRGFSLMVGGPGSYPIPPSGLLTVDQIGSESQFCAKFKTDKYQTIESSELHWPASADGVEPIRLVLRNWEPGDAIWRPGHAGPEKLKLLFQQSRVLLWERRHWPVLVQGNQIAWAWRFGPSAAFLPKQGEPYSMRITYAGPLGESR